MDPRLDAALAPRSIAIVGASDNPDKIGGRPLAYLRRFGFGGAIYPINPARPAVQGVPAVPRLADLDGAPDAVLIAVPGDAAVAALDESGRIGAKVAVVMTSGFGETGPDGKAAERAMVERARAAGLRVVGPNTQGLANFGTGAILSFSSVFTEQPPADGPVGIVSQSGAMSVVPYGLLRGRGIGVRHAHATGNDADVTVSELAAAVARDPDLKLLCVYLESLPDPHHLAEAAAVARERGLPIVALKSGRTAEGAATAASHTGALASEDRLVDAFLAQHGIWRAEDSVGLVEAAELYLRGSRPGGRRLVAISNSGATCVLAADAAVKAGLSIPKLSADTQDTLRTILPGFAAVANPVDVTAALLTDSSLFSRILPAIAADPAADAFLIGIPAAGQAYDLDAFGRDTTAFAAATGKPVVVVAPQPVVAAPFKAQGLPVFAGEGEAVQALRQFILHGELIRAVRLSRPAFGRREGEVEQPAAAGARVRDETSPEAPHPSPGRLPPTRPLPLGRGEFPRQLDEAESLAALAAIGVPVVPHRLCRTEDAAVDTASGFGSAVVVKGCSPEIAHKSELGLVHLDVQGPDAVRAAFAACRDALARAGAAMTGVLVMPMARSRRELMLGAHRDPHFGPVVIVGDGGKWVEALPDAQILLAPFEADAVRDALGRLRIAPLFAGLRGEPPMALEPFVAAAVAVGRAMTEPDSRIASLDVNPIVVGTRPDECLALDAVIFMEDGS